MQALSTGSACQAKKRNKAGLERAQEQAADVLNKPALVEGFSAVPSEPRFLGLAGCQLLLTRPYLAYEVSMSYGRHTQAAGKVVAGGQHERALSCRRSALPHLVTSHSNWHSPHASRFCFQCCNAAGINPFGLPSFAGGHAKKNM